MVTGLTYLFTSISLAILLPYINRTPRSQESGEFTIYRLSKGIRTFFLFSIPFFGAMAAFIYSTYPPGEPKGVGLFGFILIFVLMLALPSAAYVYLKTFRIQIDAKTLTVTSFFKTTRIDFQSVARITTWQDLRESVLNLHNKDGRRIFHIGSTGLDLLELTSDIERRTRSPQVMLYRGKSFEWEERTNEEHGYWHPSKGPPKST